LGAYIDEAVQSVLDQTYRDFEIVIVDDGSDDPVTQLLLASYQRPRTRVIRCANGGVARARNLGLAEAEGRYVSFLDADDCFEPAYLQTAVSALEADRTKAFASCWLRAFGHAQFSWAPERCDFPHLLAEDTVCTAALMRRDLVVEAGGFDEDPRIDGYEDWDLPVRLVAQGYDGLIIRDYLFRYRIRPGSKTETRTAQDNHAGVIEYMLAKHADLYQRHAKGVIDVINRRIEELEAALPEAPERPDPPPKDWRASILTLETHRRDLEELMRTPRASGDDDGIEWGSFRRLAPISRVWGLDRGQAIDRYYIEQFLDRHRSEISGKVLEVKDATYARDFGTNIDAVDVIDIAPDNPDSTLVADLAQRGCLPAGRADCFILTQTLHIIYEAEEVVRNAHRALRNGGVLLASIPCVSRIDYESGVNGDYWRFTPASARRLFEEVFGATNVTVESWGNVLACTAFLQGLAAEDMTTGELDHKDPYFPLLVTVRAVKPSTAETGMIRPAAVEPGSGQEPVAESIEVVEVTQQAWSPPLMGCHIDLPLVGASLPYPKVDIAGWALTAEGPVKAVELVYEDRVVCQAGSGGLRSDLAVAFPNVARAEDAGFRVQTTVLGLVGDVSLELRAVLPGEQRCSIGLIRLRVPAPEGSGGQVAVVFEAGADPYPDPRDVASVAIPIRAAFALRRSQVDGPTGHAGVRALDGASGGSWDLGADLADDLGVWLTSSAGGGRTEEVTSLVSRLVDGKVDFAALVPLRGDGPPVEPDLLSVLSGVALGDTVVVRHSAVRGRGGFDSSAPNLDAAAWDLCVRLALAGAAGVVVPCRLAPERPSVAERAGPDGARWLLAKHAPVFGSRMVDVLASRELGVGEVLRANHAAEGLIETALRPAERGLRRDRDRLAAKLRAQPPPQNAAPPFWRDLRRSKPFSEVWGSERGLCVDRYYIERFLERHRDDVRGTVLEVHDDTYTQRYGGRKVERADVLDIGHANPAATIVADLRAAGEIADGTYDCVILTHELQLIDNTEAAVSELARVLNPGGVALVSIPSISRIDPESGLDGDYWRFTESGLRRLLEPAFPGGQIEVEPHGNRAAAIAFLHGLGAAEIEWIDLDAVDRSCPLVLTAVARKAPGHVPA
jgi:glycosyltransferase involved in cell wall biosynthesis/SAM-dependent methyltransferase